MANLIEAKVGEFSIGEAFAIGVSKTLTEQLAAPYIGNGTFQSGGIKLVAAWGIPKFLLHKDGMKSWGKVIGTGLAVDGVEDIITAAMSYFKGPAPQESTGMTTL